MSKPKLIILNGFAGSGKSTVARKYIAEHPLALLVEGDELIVNLGQWMQHEAEARDAIFGLTKVLIQTHLASGRDVVLPYLVTKHSHIHAFEEIAKQCSADYFNFLLFNEKDVAIARLMERGTWGEAGLDPLTEQDMPTVVNLYDRMEAQLEHQHNVVIIHQLGRDLEQTYTEIVKHLEV